MKFFLLVIASIALVVVSAFTQAVTAAPLALNRRQEGTPTTAGEVIATPAATAASTATAPPRATATNADSDDENDGNDSGDENDGNESGDDSDDEKGGAATATATVAPNGTPAATPAPQGEAPAPITGGVEVVTAPAPVPTTIAA
ncbi:hypothetical protein HDU85_007098 [Gaertneriomyces sp. JEL0708]|nr:hypothetical protein HDU85_007098 [Gaertneriomyces sp. JEL0708]